VGPYSYDPRGRPVLSRRRFTLIIKPVQSMQKLSCPTQCGDASGTGVFDTAARAWDQERMRSIDPGLEHFFPQLTGPNEVRRSAGLPALQVVKSFVKPAPALLLPHFAAAVLMTAGVLLCSVPALYPSCAHLQAHGYGSGGAGSVGERAGGRTATVKPVEHAGNRRCKLFGNGHTNP